LSYHWFLIKYLSSELSFVKKITNTVKLLSFKLKSTNGFPEDTKQGKNLEMVSLKRFSKWHVDSIQGDNNQV
jgi:hypothetical protein